MSVFISAPPIQAISQCLSLQQGQLTAALAQTAVQDCVTGYLADSCNLATDSSVLLYGQHCLRGLKHVLVHINADEAVRQSFAVPGQQIALTDFFAEYVTNVVNDDSLQNPAVHAMLTSALKAYGQLMDVFVNHAFYSVGYFEGDAAQRIFHSAAHMLPPSLHAIEGLQGLPFAQDSERVSEARSVDSILRIDQMVAACSTPYTVERMETQEVQRRQMYLVVRQTLLEVGLITDEITSEQIRAHLEPGNDAHDEVLSEAITVWGNRPALVDHGLISDSMSYVELAELLRAQPKVLEELRQKELQKVIDEDPMAFSTLVMTQDGTYMATPFGTFEINGDDNEPGPDTSLN